MKLNQKGLMVLAIVGAVAIGGGIGAGSYAYFTSKATSTSNIIQAGTLKMKVNNGDNGTNFMTKDINVKNIYPGYKSEPQTFKIRNDGNLAMKVRISTTKINIDNILYNGKYQDNGKDKQATQRLQVKICKYEGNTNKILITNEWVNIDKLNEVILSNKIEPEKEENYTIEYRLDESAGNEFQDASVALTFDIEATQADRKDKGWGEAPVTPTN